ncbi:MFS transporter [Advenella sp. S44]|uniref:MFS transporter n=1 Tax=Advenella sp. S44 TaxID=1982755 RepID=UPI000C29DEEA|nr:MFS transporter [Advenella sp. S44]
MVTVAALVFGQLFFPSYSPLVGTLASFGTLAVGFLARPLGSVIFGHFGDRIGRKKMLITTLTMMGGSTFLIGLLPTYSSVGIWAPILLVLCRFVQGVAMGGEWGGAVLMAVEYAPKRTKGFYGSIVQIGCPAGLALGALMFYYSSSLLGEETFTAWGWRIPFLVSILLFFCGFYIRFRTAETPVFQELVEHGEIVEFPIVELFKNHSKELVCTALVYLASSTVPFYIAWVFLAYYAKTILHMDQTQVLMGMVVTNAIMSAIIIFIGKLSDRIGTEPILYAGCICMALVAFPVFWLADTTNVLNLWFAMFLVAAPLWCTFAVLPVFFSETFPGQLRYTGISFGSQASTIFGGLVPIFATAVVPQYGTWPVSVLFIVCEMLGILAVLTLRRPSARTFLVRARAN